MLSLVKSLGYMDLVDQDEGNRVYFNLIGNKVVSYLEKWVKPLMITSVFFFIATLVHGYIRKKITVLGTLGGLLLFFLTGGASYLMGQYFYSYLMNAYADQAWILAESNSTSLALFIGSIVFIFGFVALIYRLASKIFKPYNLTIGAFIVWQVLVIYSSYYYVGASYLFIWPFLMGLIGVNLNFILSWKHWKLNFLVKLAVQIPILLITAPIIYLIYNFWFLEATPIQSVLIVLMSAFMIPILCTSRKTAKKTTVPKNDENEGSPHLILNMNSN